MHSFSDPTTFSLCLRFFPHPDLTLTPPSYMSHPWIFNFVSSYRITNDALLLVDTYHASYAPEIQTASVLVHIKQCGSDYVASQLCFDLISAILCSTGLDFFHRLLFCAWSSTVEQDNFLQSPFECPSLQGPSVSPIELPEIESLPESPLDIPSESSLAASPPLVFSSPDSSFSPSPEPQSILESLHSPALVYVRHRFKCQHTDGNPAILQPMSPPPTSEDPAPAPLCCSTKVCRPVRPGFTSVAAYASVFHDFLATVNSVSESQSWWGSQLPEWQDSIRGVGRFCRDSHLGCCLSACARPIGST